MKPPVPSIPRRAMRDFSFKGYAIPAGTMIGINPLFTHHMPEIWPDPETFDPMRFTDEAQRSRHRFAWVPFGGGAHMCLGLHFAYMQAKCFARHFLQNLSVSLEPGYKPHWQMWPIPKPRGWTAGDAEAGVKLTSLTSPWAGRETLFDECRELRALVGDEHRDQFRGLGVAGIGRDQMRRARRLEERLSDLEGLDRAAAQLRTDFALGDIGGDRAGVPMRAGEIRRDRRTPARS